MRTLLIHGARSVLARAKESGLRVEQIPKRRPPSVVIVALANKMARFGQSCRMNADTTKSTSAPRRHDRRQVQRKKSTFTG
ncbi:hypothetical protein bAD24_p00260 (plasmid) [Burkholderia sp. AD24]|nr:hypothetical protein bAD24_p00260 [Burkholderia sp. AD24]